MRRIETALLKARPPGWAEHHARYAEDPRHPLSAEELEQAIRLHAFELFVLRCHRGLPANPPADWLQAEREVLMRHEGIPVGAI